MVTGLHIYCGNININLFNIWISNSNSFSNFTLISEWSQMLYYPKSLYMVNMKGTEALFLHHDSCLKWCECDCVCVCVCVHASKFYLFIFLQVRQGYQQNNKYWLIQVSSLYELAAFLAFYIHTWFIFVHDLFLQKYY